MTPDEIRDTRRALGVTQSQFAALLGVSMQSVAAWEQGTRPISRLVENAVQNVVKSNQLENTKP